MSATTNPSLRMSYRIGRGEQGVLTFEPYKSALLPLWRFRTLPIAKQSSEDLWDRFLFYDAQNDFVGMDMARKFIQMGMTRAKRYANYKGGRKYDRESGRELEKRYLEKKKVFVREQKLWDKEQKALGEVEREADVEDGSTEDVKKHADE
ncbi:hypothetical protein MMC16_005260 [Acarospora aff. strigata]|nr:hypothetical protein [Acarospora aff. strigata]